MRVKQVLYGLLIGLLTSCSGYTKKDGKVYLRSSNEARIGVEYTEVVADYETFEVIDHDINIDLAKDKKHVYKGTSILIDADPNTFEQIENYYWKDKDHVYLLQFGGDNCKINGADPGSFEVIKDFLWTKDKNHVYYEFKKLLDVDPAEFTALEEDWGKDNNFYFYHNLKVDSLDYSTAEIVSRYYIKDKNHVFFKDTIVYDANPGTFKADGAGSFGHDDTYMFDWEKNKGPITEKYKRTYIDKK